jgi:hypothetical protein
MADDGWVDTPTDTSGGWKDTDAAPVTAGGVASQLLVRGPEAGLAHVAGAPVDIATEQLGQFGFAKQALKDVAHGLSTAKGNFWSLTGPGLQFGEYGDKPTMPTQDQPVPGGSEWMMGQAGKVSPQLDPRNYPAQNWPERIARGAGDVGTQAALGRVAGYVGTGAPSSVAVAKQLAGSTLAGAGGGAGGQFGRGVAEHAIDVLPDFRTLHPLATEAIENVGGVIGGGVGGLTASGAASRARIAAGEPAAGFTSDQLIERANRQYAKGRSIPANYTVPAVAQWANNHLQTLYGNYGSSEIGPIVARLNKLANPPATAGYVPLTELTALDDALGTVVKKNIQPGGMTKLGSAAADTQSAIKSFIRNPTPQAIHSGDPQLAARYFNVADGNFAAGKRSQTIERAQQQGERSGNLEGAVGKLTDPAVIAKRLRGFTPDEQEQLDRFSQGAPIRNAMGWTGHQLTHGAGLGSMPFMMYEGYEKAGIPGAIGLGLAPAATGYALHRGKEALANRALNRIAEQTRQRSPAYQAIPMAERPASPFRTTIPVGLGAVSGLWGQ